MVKPRAEPKFEAGQSLTSHNCLHGSCDFFVGKQSIFVKRLCISRQDAGAVAGRPVGFGAGAGQQSVGQTS